MGRRLVALARRSEPQLGEAAAVRVLHCCAYINQVAQVSTLRGREGAQGVTGWLEAAALVRDCRTPLECRRVNWRWRWLWWKQVWIRVSGVEPSNFKAVCNRLARWNNAHSSGQFPLFDVMHLTQLVKRNTRSTEHQLTQLLLQPDFLALMRHPHPALRWWATNLVFPVLTGTHVDVDVAVHVLAAAVGALPLWEAELLGWDLGGYDDVELCHHVARDHVFLDEYNEMTAANEGPTTFLPELRNRWVRRCEPLMVGSSHCCM